ncbi:hypothetical protein IFM89_010206 [Coptis chinensis]|uniref:Uncharacterized protein n=1 Tax=Coptis chinensis TaxID=261450 RepID=A0A835GYX6_9MAGN|nr:hypothetical protein IFM89_010206 [Coptis chinensis]
MPNRYRILLYLIVGESLVVLLSCIAARYSTTVYDLMNISAMGSIVVKAGDILIVSLPDAWENSWSSLTLTSTRKFVGA